MGGASFLPAQNTAITVGNTVLQNSVKRLGINLGSQNNYDSGQMMKNLLYINPGFEAEIYQSVILCGKGAAGSCTDDNVYSSWPQGFWNGATFEMIYGSSLGGTGTIASYSPANGAS